jgi:Raf kinase inhibitor-like YbhB/YbcL family protein
MSQNIFGSQFKRVIKTVTFLTSMIALCCLAACGSISTEVEKVPTATDTASETTLNERVNESHEFKLESSAFKNGDSIPAEYSCEGEDFSPPLNWSGAPQGTQTFAIIMEDPDAPVGTWVHWVLYNLPANAEALPAAVESPSDLPPGTQVGLNDWDENSYGGPCPPSGTHRYFFYIFALDSEVKLGEGATSAALREAISGHTLAQTEHMGTFSR